MSPRPTARPDDPEGVELLTGAARVIDKHLADTGPEGATSANSHHFPAMDWLRLADVATAAGRDTNAIYRRWEGRDAFLRDAVAFTLRYADTPEQDWHPLADRLRDGLDPAAPLSHQVTEMAGDILDRLADSPRSYLLMHMVPVMSGFPDLREAAQSSDAEATRVWAGAIHSARTALGLRLRPGLDDEQVSIGLQALTEGFLLRGRLHQADHAHRKLFVASVQAYLIGVIDFDDTGRPVAAALDDHLRGAATC